MLDRVKPTRISWPPDSTVLLTWRQNRLAWLREDPVRVYHALEYYGSGLQGAAMFIQHWGTTANPKNAGTDVPIYMPFILFPRQQELLQFLWECYTSQNPGLIEKSRDMGATWLCCAFSVWLWRFYPGIALGWGSRKQDLVDQLGVLDSIFEKIRVFIRWLPPEFWPTGFNPDVHMPSMRIINPENGATIAGEIGDNIGRGGRKRMFFKDESAHYERPELVEAALMSNTDVPIDISSVHGLGNVFHRKREAGAEWYPGANIPKGQTRVFVMDWSDHPAKTQEWYARERRNKQNEGLGHVFAQEVERNYSAAVIGTIIPAEHVRAAIDAHIKLGFKDDGQWGAALDVADEGLDTNALAIRRGVVLTRVDEWAAPDPAVTARKAINLCKTITPIEIQYDCIGVGASVKAEGNRLTEEQLMPKGLRLVPWNAGAGVLDPEKPIIFRDKDSPLNEDFYANLKAQGWWQLRLRFERTWRAVLTKELHTLLEDTARSADKDRRVQELQETLYGGPVIDEQGNSVVGPTDPDAEYTWDSEDLISIPSQLPLLRKIEKELSQPTIGQSSKLKLLVNKTPDGTKSPNVADAIMMCYWPVPTRKPMMISPEVLARASIPGR